MLADEDKVKEDGYLQKILTHKSKYNISICLNIRFPFALIMLKQNNKENKFVSNVKVFWLVSLLQCILCFLQ